MWKSGLDFADIVKSGNDFLFLIFPSLILPKGIYYITDFTINRTGHGVWKGRENEKDFTVGYGVGDVSRVWDY